MNNTWDALLSILPSRLRSQVDRLGKTDAQNLRLRLDTPPELNCATGTHWLEGNISREDLDFCVNTASRYSPWASATVSKGYITAKGGHRLGICGEAVIKNGVLCGMRNISSVCIRIARDVRNISGDLDRVKGSLLILGAPGWGKTTLLRDLIRKKSGRGTHICVLDQREELFPFGISRGCRIDVLSGCPKGEGMDMLLRTMAPDIIAMDEITAAEDCKALEQAAWCGVDLIATAHASSLQDLCSRPVYYPLVRQNLFDHIVILRKDKSWTLERSKTWTANGSARY